MSQVVSLPQVTIVADGVPFPPEGMRALSAVQVQQRLSVPTLCELTYNDPPGPLDAATLLVPGTTLSINVGAHVEPLFGGEVTAIEHVYGPAGEREIRVRGYDLLHRLRKRQSVRAHVQMNLRELAQELVADVGLEVQADDPGPLWPRLIQYRQSDLQLLVDVAERHGLYLALRENVLHLLTLEGIGIPVPLVLGESLLEARVEVNGEPACRSVTAMGWNPVRVESYEGQASSARVGRQVIAQAPPAQVGGSGEQVLLDKTAPSSQHTEAVAQAELDRRIAYEVTLWGAAEGNPLLRPGAPIIVTGIADLLMGRYVLTSVTHTIDGRRGFLSEIATAPPPRRAQDQRPSATLGVVTRVDDPEDLGRVQVSLPTYSDVESEWMHVLSPGAGTNKGLVALPDVGDDVLLIFFDGDPGQGVILGGLYGMQGPPDSGVVDQAVRRYTFRTPGGQRIRLDDARGVIRVQNSGGSYVDLSPSRVLVHAAGDLELEAPGHSVIIRGQAIDFERAE
jgi:phage baseplate assembly protein V